MLTWAEVKLSWTMVMWGVAVAQAANAAANGFEVVLIGVVVEELLANLAGATDGTVEPGTLRQRNVAASKADPLLGHPVAQIPSFFS